MEKYFNFSTIVLILIAVAPHYYYGKLLQVKHFLNRIIVGLCFSAFIVAILANIYAAAISIYILVSVLLGYAFILADIIKYLLKKKNNDKLSSIFKDNNGRTKIIFYLILTVLGIVIFLLNSPRFSMIVNSTNGLELSYNRHLSYYSSQSVEMLNAEYGGRLKILNAYPAEWMKYHFFNASTQAIGQVFVKNAGLFSYLTVQVVFAALILLAILESLYHELKYRLINIFIPLVWLVIGFTLFGLSLKWNFITTGPLSIFAIVNIFMFLQSKKYSDSAIYILILGASAIRLIPTAAFMFLFIFLYESRFKFKIFFHVISGKSGYIMKGTFFLLFILYSALTVLSGNDSIANNSGGSYSFHLEDSWHNQLFFSRIIRLFMTKFDVIFEKNVFSNIAGTVNFKNGDYFNKILENNFIFIVFALIFAASLIALFLKFLKSVKIIIRKKYKVSKEIFLFLPILCFFAAAVPKTFIVYIPYYAVVCCVLIILNSKQNELSYQLNRVVTLILYLQIFSLLFSVFGINSGIAEPVLYITIDVALWSLLGILLLLQESKKIRYQISLGITSIICAIFFQFNLIKLPRMWDIDNHQIIFNISVLTHPDFNRSDYVDEDGFLIRLSGDPDTDDVYSAVLGARLRYNAKYDKLINYRFIGKIE